jgi:NADH-quinone oxidoreductase subunit G
MPTIYIDGKSFEVAEGRNLLHAALSLGLDVPYFCWHPALGSVGACRQCAVKQFLDESDTAGKIVMACMTPAVEGARFSIDDAEARAFRAQVIEWLMLNHPHDCPVCDEGGECHLQDMTLMTGHVYRRYRFRKRTFRNQDLGPFIHHEMNRCIECYRCVRFYRDYAGGRDLDVFAAHDHVYFGRHQDGPLESPFSGNLVEVCPTGVFTDKTLKRHYTRKWDLATAPSVCTHCSLGCNTLPGERYGTLRRVQNRYHHEVNGYFLCDRGRYGYEFVNSPRRLRRALVHAPGGRLEPLSAGAALERARTLLLAGARLIGIGSPRASLEANFALRSLVGPECFSNGMSRAEAALVRRGLELLEEGPARSPSLADAERATAVLVLGEDLLATGPRLALALRQAALQEPRQAAAALGIPLWLDASVRDAVQEKKGPFFLATATRTGLEDLATEAFHGPPAELARLGFAVAHALDPRQPEPPALAREVSELAARIARALSEAARPLVVAGTSLGSLPLLEAAGAVAAALSRPRCPAALALVTPEANSLGAALLGSSGIEGAFAAVEAGAVDAAVILENDIGRRAPAREVAAFFARLAHVIAIDSVETDTVRRAALALPAASFAEADGTFVSSEGRAQRFFQVFAAPGDVEESWRWLRDLMLVRGRAEGLPLAEVEGWHGLDDLLASLARSVPRLAAVRDAAPPASFRRAGRSIPRQPHRYSGRTALHAGETVHEPKPPSDPDAPLAFSMEGFPGRVPSALLPRYWAGGWNSVQALNKFQSEVGGPLEEPWSGVRLLEPAAPESAGSAPRVLPDEALARFEPRRGEWLLLPIHHLFGSEELSLLAPAVAARAPVPYVALHPDDAAAIGLAAQDEALLALDGAERRLPVELREDVARGTAGLPAGLPELAGVELPAWSRLSAGGRR